MALRNSEMYLSRETKRRLRWIAEIEKHHHDNVTWDGVGERLLNERIEQLYPNIKDLEREFERAESELVSKLANP